MTTATAPVAVFRHVTPLRPGDEPQRLQADLRMLVASMGGPAAALATDPAERFAVLRVPAGATLVHQGSPARALHVVQTGSFKCIQTAEDGYEHVLAFAGAGEVIGYDGLDGLHHAFSAVALEDSRVAVLPLSTLSALRRRAPAFDEALQAGVARQLAQAGEVAYMMAAVAAEARLARFLVRLSARMAGRGQSPRRLLLRMNRRDIANHLGLAHETVSRAFRLLADQGWVQVHNREVEIVDADGLRRCARSTRGSGDDGTDAPREPLACAA